MSQTLESRPRTNTGSTSIPQKETMLRRDSARAKREPRDTGFPEPFHSGPNTTLPHPEADLSPNATLSYEDVSAERMIKRHRLSFLKKNKRTVSHGVIDPQSEALTSILSLTMSELDVATNQQCDQTTNTNTTTSLRFSKDSVDSEGSADSAKADDETPPTSPDVPEHRRKSGIFARLKKH